MGDYNFAAEKAEELKRRWQAKCETLKIGLIGQPGAGKSSLINKMIGKDIFKVGVHTDTTVEPEKARYGELDIVDLPGYGTGRFPVNEWVEKFKPEELDLYIFVFSGKLHKSDGEIFDYLKQWRQERSHPYFIVRNKNDDIWDDEKSLVELQQEIIADVHDHMKDNGTQVFFTSCRDMTGIKELKKAIESEDTLAVKRSKLIANFRADSLEDLDKKREVCLDDVSTYAWAAAANGINPLPGLDISVDIGILYRMFSDIRRIFGIGDEDKAALAKYEVLLPILKKVFDYATKEGILLLLKELASKYLAKEAEKYIPIAGWGIAAYAGYKITEYMGNDYVDDCYELAKASLEDVIKNQSN